jgi:sec-independent protein translocase protein TatB
MSFSDTIFIFFLVLILFGPKKLPEIARQAGKLMAELRRASNEFKSQIETEIARAEVAKHDLKQASLPPAEPPQGAVASFGQSPTVAGETAAPESSSSTTLSAPPATSLAEPATPSAPENAPAPQDSHV